MGTDAIEESDSQTQTHAQREWGHNTITMREYVRMTTMGKSMSANNSDRMRKVMSCICDHSHIMRSSTVHVLLPLLTMPLLLYTGAAACVVTRDRESWWYQQ
jgi:hypothetical protein